MTKLEGKNKSDQLILVTRVRMKFYLFSVVIVALCKVESLDIVSENISIQEALAKIALSLAQQNYLVSVVDGGVSNDRTTMMAFASFADIPHVAAKFVNDLRNFALNSSAFVLLDSITSLRTFNDRAVLPSAFSMS